MRENNDADVPQKSFFKDNFVLIVGLALPVLLIVGFMLASALPQALSDPPEYDFVFSTTDYPPNASNLPVSVRLVVKDGVLKAQYVRAAVAPGSYPYNSWKKLYVYEAGPRKVRELTFGFPADMDKIERTKEETVEATKDMKLSTTLQSPDGYELSYDGYSNSGLLNEVFWGAGHSSEPRLRKSSSSVRLTTADGRTYFSYGNVEFVGWATPTH
jgi:hypothetical protein